MNLIYALIGFVLLCHFPMTATATQPTDESVARGRILFTKRACANCHALDGKADSVGPNFGKFEKKLSRSEAIENLLNPSKEISKGYESTVVITQQGKVVTGRVASETSKQITLLVSAEGNISSQSFQRTELEEIIAVQTSIMPTDLLKGLTKTQIDDLLDYLVSIEVIDPKKPNKPVDSHVDHAHHQSPTPPYTGPDTRPKFDEVDREIVIEVIPKKMQYDVELFDVRPGSRVKLTLVNGDEMQHNLFLCSEGQTTWLDVAKAAWALGADGPRQRYVPNSTKVLHHTRLVDPDSKDSIFFVAPTKEGIYPYVCTIPGHAFLMRGEMHVLSGRRGLGDLTYRYYEGSWKKLPNFDELTPTRTGTLETNLLDIREGRNTNDHFGFVFDGKFHAAIDGEYRFHVVSDDGSRILIDGKTVLDNDGIHPDGHQTSGTIQLKQGEHEFQLQFFEAEDGETLFAGWTGPGVKMRALTADKSTLAELHDSVSYRMLVEDSPRVVRLNMPDASARAIAVGLMGGMNYCFDASTCHVLYGWSGEFLDVGPDRGYGRGRGGGQCKLLGPRFDISGKDQPLKIGASSEQPHIQFTGYRRSVLGPTFRYNIGEIKVEQFIEPSRSGKGLRMNFGITPTPKQPVAFHVAPESLDFSSSTGEWKDRTVTIPAHMAASFSITLEPKQ